MSVPRSACAIAFAIGLDPAAAAAKRFVAASSFSDVLSYVPVRTYIIGHAVNFATRSRSKVGWRHLGLATTPRTGAPGLETARNYVVGKSVPHVTAETFQFKNWATFGFQRYSWLRLNFRQRRIHYTRDQPQKLDSRRHDIRTTLTSCIIS